MSYWDEEYFNEPSEADELIGKIKMKLSEAVKEEHQKEMKRLREENAELQDFKARKKEIENEHKSFVREMSCKLESAERNAMQANAEKLLMPLFVPCWTLEEYLEYPDKCPDCNETREITFFSPSGKEYKEPCPICGVSKSVKKYRPRKDEIGIMTVSKRGRVKDNACHYYIVIDHGDYYECDKSIASINRYNGDDFAECPQPHLLWFEDESDCIAYCNWANGDAS